MIQGVHHESTIPYLQLITGNPSIVYMAIYVRYLPCLSVCVVDDRKVDQGFEHVWERILVNRITLSVDMCIRLCQICICIIINQFHVLCAG